MITILIATAILGFCLGFSDYNIDAIHRHFPTLILLSVVLLDVCAAFWRVGWKFGLLNIALAIAGFYTGHHFHRVIAARTFDHDWMVMRKEMRKHQGEQEEEQK